MTITTGETHANCGMVFKLKDESVEIDMTEYIKDTIEEFPGDCSK